MSSIANFFRETFHVLGGILRPAARSVRDNTGLAALSVVLAFGIWVVVTQADNPSRSRVVAPVITVEPIHVPGSVAVVEPIPSVQVRVTVPDSVFDSLTAADFRATVDLENLSVGDYERPVVVTSDNRGGLRVDEVLPEKIKISLAPLKTKEVPVAISVQGNPASGYTMGPPVTDDTNVLVSGPVSQVDEITQVTATFSVDAMTDDVDQSVHLEPRKANGELVTGVKLTPEITGLRIDIKQQTFSRSVAVSPQITGAPAAGYNVVSVTVNPPTVTISGTQALINTTTTIPTKSIDLDDATADVVKGVSLDLPPGAEVTGGPPSVTVTVKIAPAEGNFTFAVPITAVNLGANFTINGALPTVTVTLFGPLPLLQALGPADISATVDLSGDDPGAHRKQVKLTPPGGASIRSVNPSEITVTLEQR
jgi:YbbR domain-containing protein